MDHAVYSTEDFLADESFQAFVLERDPTATQFWRSWLIMHPAKEPDFNEAVAVLALFLTHQHQPVSAALQQQELTKLWKSMRRGAAPIATRPALRTARARRWAGAGLAASALLLAGLGLWRQSSPNLRPAASATAWTRYATPAGARRQLTLPDGSRVTLNANSELKLAATWPAGQALREVWLTGEAFFEVRHTAPPELRAVAAAPAAAKFIVHAGTLDVAVLGTQFNVHQAAGKTEVVLTAGQVQLRRPGPGAEPAAIIMRPGELVKYDEKTPWVALERRSVRAALYSAWVSGRLDLKDTPVADIVAMLEDRHGVKITLNNPDLSRQKLTGSLPNHDLNTLLDALSKSLDVNVRRQGNQVWLDSPAAE